CSFKRTGENWIDKSGSYEIAFISGTDKKVSALRLTVCIEFLRGEPVTNAIEKVIRESGIEAGLRKYDEIRDSGNTYYFFSEQMLHQLGHTLQKENKIDDAILVFLKNTQEYPDSFMANDALAEILLKAGDNKRALEYFEKAVRLKPDYDYGKRMIGELKQNK
nr:tetratricopeptide repeat protein [Bacteroidales bacterium]